MPYPVGHNARVVAPAVGLGVLAIALVASSSAVQAEVGPGMFLRACLVLLAVMAIPLVSPDAGVISRFGPANTVTMVRLVMAAVTAACIGRQVSSAVLWWIEGLVVAFAVLDGVDGRLARARGTASAFGARFDMETDAAFILILSLLVWQQHATGMWVLLGGLMRYAFVAAGWALSWLAAPLRPTSRGRTVAVVQFIGLAVALLPPVDPWVRALAAGGALLLLAWSFGLDVSRLWRARHEPASVLR